MRLSSFFGAVALAALAVTADIAAAHPGHNHVTTSAEHAQRKLFVENGRRSLKACADSPHARELQQRVIERRTAKLAQLRDEHAARRRLDAATVLAKSHKSSLTGVSNKTDAATLFGTTPKCILEPEVTEGPYYVSGELVRTDIRESQAGVDLYTELQIIDVNTCKPVESMYIDFWHCNTTGVYAGVVANGNGNSNDKTNIDKTFNRGLAPTDKDGVVTFLTTFPGHYTGRATHIHVLGSKGGSLLSNNTYVGSKAAHVGQIFFDQDLITQVEATTAYKVNTQTLTTNAKDSIFTQSAATGFDPVVEYALLGDSVEDGIFSWISIGVDTTISKSVSAAATLTANGGQSGTAAGASGTRGNAAGTSGTSGSSSTPSATSSATSIATSLFATATAIATAATAALMMV